MTSAKKKVEEPTAEYVVTRKHTQVAKKDRKIGEVVHLTKHQAKSLVNKVALKSEQAKHAGVISEGDAVKALGDATKEIEKLQKLALERHEKVEALTTQVADLEAALKAKG